MSILDSFTYVTPALAYDDKLRQLITTHKTYIREHSTTAVSTINNSEMMVHQYNLYGYLNKIGINTSLHWIVLMINGIQTPTDFTVGMDSLLIPDLRLIEEIITMQS